MFNQTLFGSINFDLDVQTLVLHFQMNVVASLHVTIDCQAFNFELTAVMLRIFQLDYASLYGKLNFIVNLCIWISPIRVICPLSQVYLILPFFFELVELLLCHQIFLLFLF